MTSLANLQTGGRDHEGLSRRHVVCRHDGGLTPILVHL